MSLRPILLAALSATALIPVAASAQSAGEIRHDRRQIREDMRRGDWRAAREDRQELRDDWEDYRRAHPDVYRRGRYQGPRGYRYHPVDAGYRFAPGYYGQHYWISDYGRFRLPPPQRFSRWVRYGNDAVLVNTRNGRVIAVRRGFFW